MDRAFLAALPLSHAGLLEPHSNRLAIRHRFHCHAMTLMKHRRTLAAAYLRGESGRGVLSTINQLKSQNASEFGDLPRVHTGA
jgi:hypothetical protein